jgi:hypothetical protein
VRLVAIAWRRPLRLCFVYDAVAACVSRSVIVAVDKCIVIDTGCGSDLRALIDSRINLARLPYLVVCTHVHFDVRVSVAYAALSLSPSLSLAAVCARYASVSVSGRRLACVCVHRVRARVPLCMLLVSFPSCRSLSRLVMRPLTAVACTAHRR